MAELRAAVPRLAPRGHRVDRGLELHVKKGYPVITAENVERYLARLAPAPDAVLAEMEAHGERDGIPIVPPETGRLLHVLALATGARRVVEVGTAIGVSTLYLARALPADGLLVSFDVDEERQGAARDYLERAGVADRVDLRLQDGRSGLAALAPPFDLAFIDAVKEEYGDYLEGALRLVRPGGLILADNALMGGAVATGEPLGGWTSDRIAGARAFNERIASDPRLTGTVLPVGDGLAVAVVRAVAE
jgi:predicted O-methyltransferase YrrM